MSPFGRNEKVRASEDEPGWTAADEAALRPLESLPPEACPPELAERTIRCLCARAREAQTPAPTVTSRPHSHDLEDFWLCLSSNILMK